MKENSEEITDLPQMRSNNYVSIYSNSVNMMTSPWDIRLIFSEIKEDADGKAVSESKASIVMSPQHAKALLMILAKNIQGYESQHGVINVAWRPEKAPEVESSDSQTGEKPAPEKKDEGSVRELTPIDKL